MEVDCFLEPFRNFIKLNKSPFFHPGYRYYLFVYKIGHYYSLAKNEGDQKSLTSWKSIIF